MSYSSIAKRGIAWVGLFRAFMRVSSFIRVAILARLLTPQDFGIFGISVVVLGLLEMITETGINVFLIQQGQAADVKGYNNSAYVVSIIRGFVLFIVILIASPFITTFFQAPSALSLLIATAFIPLIRAFINPMIIRFQKDLQFNLEFIIRSVLILIESAVAISLAYIYRTPLSLVLGMLIAALVEVFLSHLLIKPRPKLQFNSLQVRRIISQGKWVTASGVMAYIVQKLPDIIIGRIYTATTLGVFHMAYRFAVVPIEEVIEVFNRVAFPVYSKFSQDKPRLKRALYINFASVTVLSISLATLIYIASPTFTTLVLGNQWLEVIPYLRLLAGVGILLAISAPPNPLFLATKNQKLLSLTVLVQLVGFSLALLPLTLHFHLTGIIFAYALGLLCALPFKYLFAYRVLKS